MINYSKRRRRKTRERPNERGTKISWHNFLPRSSTEGFGGTHPKLSTQCPERSRRIHTSYTHVNTLLLLMSTKHMLTRWKKHFFFFKRHPQHGQCPSSLSFTKTTPLIFLLFPSVKMPTHNDRDSNTLICSPLLAGNEPTIWAQSQRR